MYIKKHTLSFFPLLFLLSIFSMYELRDHFFSFFEDFLLFRENEMNKKTCMMYVCIHVNLFHVCKIHN